MIDAPIRLIDLRHEAAVVHAADAYARVSGRPGVALVTAGPGVANAIAGLATAFEAGSPLVLIAGSAPLALVDRGALQEADEVALARPVTKWTRRVHQTERLAEYVDMAFEQASTGRPGPVLIVVPQDILASSTAVEVLSSPPSPASVPHPAPGAVEAATEILSGAERPVIVAGAGARWSLGASAALRELAESTGIPVLGKGLGRGVVPEDMDLGMPYAVARVALPAADAVLVVGARLNWTLHYGQAPRWSATTRLVHVDVNAAELGRNRPADVAIAADAGATVRAISADAATRGYRPRNRAWLAQFLLQRTERLERVVLPDDGPVHPLQLAQAFGRAAGDDPILVGDGANILNWGRAVLRVRRPGSWIEHAPFGAMGVGIPFAIGARAASEDVGRATGMAPRRVFLLSGDGAFGFFPMELSSAARHRLPFLAAVANDCGWGADRNTQLVRFGRNHGVDLGEVHYDEMARALGCAGIRVAGGGRTCRAPLPAPATNR